MKTHVFNTSGSTGGTVLVHADSEIKARGKAQKELPSGMVPQYQGTLEELTENDVYKV
jgi:hypothetical protein